MTKFIAERRLFYSLKNNDAKTEFFVRLYAPYHVEDGMVNFPVGNDGCSGCHVEVESLNERLSEEFYGADSIQALQLASNGVEFILKRLQKKYNLYHLNSEPYFDEEPTRADR